jgi:hypothetical protein
LQSAKILFLKTKKALALNPSWVDKRHRVLVGELAGILR